MPTPLAIFGLDVAELVSDAVRAFVDLIVPDFGADWASRLVTWLVALPPVTGDAFPSLNRYAAELTAVGFGLLGATFIATAVQLAAGTTTRDAGDALKRTAIAAGMLATYPTLMTALVTGVNVVTAEMVRHPLIRDGLDKAFGEALVVAAITSGVSLGLAAGAAIVVLYFVAALFVMKIGLTAALAVTTLAGALVWGLYPLPQAQWLPRAWGAALVAAITVPIAWACVFSAAALLAADTLAFDNTSTLNRPLGEGLENLVKPFAAVACFWLAYRAPGFLLGLARTAGLNPTMLRAGAGPAAAGAGPSHGRGPEAMVARGVRTNAERFRAMTQRAAGVVGPKVAARRAASVARAATSKVAATPPVRAARRGNDTWRALPDGAQTASPRRRGTSAAAGPGPRENGRAANRTTAARPQPDTGLSSAPERRTHQTARRSPGSVPAPRPASADSQGGAPQARRPPSRHTRPQPPPRREPPTWTS